MGISAYYKKILNRETKTPIRELIDSIREIDERTFFVQAFALFFVLSLLFSLVRDLFFDLEQDPIETFVSISFATLLALNLLYLRIKRNIKALTLFVLVTLTVGLALILVDGGFRGNEIYSWYVYPAIVFFLVGLKRGFLWIASFFVLVLLLAGADYFGWIELFYSYFDIFYVFLNTIIISIIYILYEKSREKAQVRSKQFISIVESMGMGIFVIDDKRNIVFVNDKVKELLNFKESDLIGNKFEKKIAILDEDGNNLLEEKELILDSVIKDNEIKRINCIIPRRSGSELDAVATFAPISSNSSAVGAVISFYDAGKEKELERTRSEFISLASHELRTPLSIINMNLEMLQQEDIINPSIEEYLEEIQKATRNMNELAGTLLGGAALKFGKLEIKSEPINLKDIIDNELNTLSLFIKEKNIEVVKNISDDAQTIYNDPQLLRIVVLNLLSNAVKYNSNNGSITVSLYNTNGKVVLKVSDTGKGIPKDEYDKIFIRKFRGKKAHSGGPGSGIGLYTVRTILDNVGGDISFESEEGSGSTFCVELPVSKTYIS